MTRACIRVIALGKVGREQWERTWKKMDRNRKGGNREAEISKRLQKQMIKTGTDRLIEENMKCRGWR